MKILAYCYGPFSEEKRVFCKNFVKTNSSFKLVEADTIRKEITGSIVPISKESEQRVREEIKDKCCSILNSKKFNVILNGLMLNKESRISLISAIGELYEDAAFKKAAISFIEDNLNTCFEKNLQKKYYKDVSFDILKKQFLSFKNAESKEEGDLLINKIEEIEGQMKLDTKIWGNDKIIYCNSFKKLEEYIQYIESF